MAELLAGTTGLVVIALLVMYFGRSIKKVASSIELAVDVGHSSLQAHADNVDLEIDKKYGKMHKSAEKSASKNELFSRKEYKASLKNVRETAQKGNKEDKSAPAE